MAADQQDAASSQIAAHYEQAGLSVQAIPYYLRAGEVASRVYAHDEALLALQRAATLLASTSHSPQDLPWQTVTAVYERLGDILEMIGRHDEAEQSYQQASKPVPAQDTLLHARLCRKFAVTRDYPPHLAESSRAYQEAAQLLQQIENQETQEWRNEWIHAHLGHLQVLFLQGEWQEMTRIIEQIQPLVEQHGTADQRANFFIQVAMRDAVRDRYVLAPATLATCHAGLQAGLETGNPHLIGTARFSLGYCLLLSGQFEQAEDHLRAALLAGEQVGDAELVARCRLHFLPLVLRRRGRVEAIRSTIADAEKRGERRFAAVMAAQRAWIAWRDGRREDAEAAGRAALEAWQRQLPAYPFQWAGLWPLIDLAASSERLAIAVDYVRLLLAPTQQRSTETLATILEEVLHAWDAGQRERVPALLQRALRLAQDAGYL